MSDLAPSLSPLSGGHSGRTFLSEVAGERSVVRIYPPGDVRGPVAPDIDAAVLRLVRGLVPVPDVLDVRPGGAEVDTAGRPGLLVTSWVPGERGDVVVAGLDEDGLRRLGRALGRVAGTLAGMPALRPGRFVDGMLGLADLPGADLPAWVESRLSHWEAEERTRLVLVAEQAQDLLDQVDRTCLVHSDLNPKNVLVDPDLLEVTAVVDWEFAHAGHPWTDVGNLVRFERHPAYVDGVLESWTGLRGGNAASLLDGARAADLWALVDLAARPADHAVATRAAALLHAIARTGDVHAWPGGS